MKMDCQNKDCPEKKWGTRWDGNCGGIDSDCVHLCKYYTNVEPLESPEFGVGYKLKEPASPIFHSERPIQSRAYITSDKDIMIGIFDKEYTLKEFWEQFEEV